MPTTTRTARSLDTTAPAVVTLPSGVRFVAIPLPQRRLASVGVYVRAGSAIEPRALNGISHMLEHMVFKGTASRDVARINLDAESLGAEVDAHTDKDHTAYLLRGRPEHAVRFIELLADLVRHATFPEAELARERSVLLQEAAELADDPIDKPGGKRFDHAAGACPAAQPVIGSRATRYGCSAPTWRAGPERHYSAQHRVAAAGAIDAEALARAVEVAFAETPAANRAPSRRRLQRGVRSRRSTAAARSTSCGVSGGGARRRRCRHRAGRGGLRRRNEPPLLDELRERQRTSSTTHLQRRRFRKAAASSRSRPRRAREPGGLPARNDAAAGGAGRGRRAVDLDARRHQLAVRYSGRRAPRFAQEQGCAHLFRAGPRARPTPSACTASKPRRRAVSAVSRDVSPPVGLALAGSLERAIAERARRWLQR